MLILWQKKSNLPIKWFHFLIIFTHLSCIKVIIKKISFLLRSAKCHSRRCSKTNRLLFRSSRSVCLISSHELYYWRIFELISSVGLLTYCSSYLNQKVDQKKLRAELDVETATHDATRYHWKYSIGVYGVSGAPFFVAN